MNIDNKLQTLNIADKSRRMVYICRGLKKKRTGNIAASSVKEMYVTVCVLGDVRHCVCVKLFLFTCISRKMLFTICIDKTIRINAFNNT